MKKIALSSAVISAVVAPVMAFALSSTVPPGDASIGSITTLITQIETFMWIIFGGIAVIMFVVAGIMFLTAQGQPEKIQAARSAFIWGIAGVVVAIIAYSILAIVGSALNV